MESDGKAPDKRVLSNTRRLLSLKEKKRGRNLQAEQIKSSLRNLDSKIGPLNNKIVFQSDDSDDECTKQENGMDTTKLSLFPSDSEGEEDNVEENAFRIRKQAPKYAEDCTDERFKLSEMFMEDSAEVGTTEGMDIDSEEKTEKEKNLEILEKVLGFQLPTKLSRIDPEAAKKKKKYVHFNPEDEESLKYLKKVEPKENTIMDKPAVSTEEKPVVSVPERYYEVSADLKSVLEEPTKEFSLSKTFGFCDGGEESFPSDTFQDHSSSFVDQDNMTSKNKATKPIQPKSFASARVHQYEQQRKFFILPGDVRLTEGVKVFKREKSMEEIREDFFRNRELVLEIFKKKKKSKRFEVPRRYMNNKR